MKFRITILLLTMIISISCNKINQSQTEDLNGHWHIFEKETKTSKKYYKLDIVNDSLAFLEGINNLKQLTGYKVIRI